MTWAARVAASNKEVPMNVINHARDGQSKEKVEPSVVFKPEAANGGKVKNISKNNLSFGNFTEKDVVNPVPVHRASIAPVPVAASTVLSQYPRTMSAPPKMDEQIKAAKLNQEISKQEKTIDQGKESLPPSGNSSAQGAHFNPAAASMGMQFIPANPYYYPDMYGMGQVPYGQFPVYYSPQTLPNGTAPPKPLSSNTVGGSSLPPVPTPKRSSAIKIKNPNTKEEVDLKAILKDKPVSTEKAASPIKPEVQSAPVANVVLVPEQVSTFKPPQTPTTQKVVVQPRSSSAIKIVDPSKNQVVDFNEVLKKEKQKEHALQQQVELKAEVKPPSDLKTPVTVSVPLSTSAPSKASPGADSLRSEAAEDTLVSPESMDETSIVSGDLEEDGEIPEPIILTTNLGIKYPDSLKNFIPNLALKRYSKEFLMAYESLDLPKPAELPTVEEMRGDEKPFKSSGDRRSFQSGNRGSGKSFDYSGRDRYSEPKGMTRSKKGSQRASGRGSNASNRMSKSQAPIEVLVKSESAWTPHNQLKKKNEDLVEVTSRQVKGLLNKLTVEKFDVVSDQILNIGIIDEHILSAIISIIFEKALDEPNFGSMYAQLCYKLTYQLFSVQPWTGEAGPKNKFRLTLVTKCQHEFQKNAKWTEEDGLSSEERSSRRKTLESLSPEEKLKFAEEEYERSKLKRRVLGNIRFVGELFIKGMIGEKIMHQCVIQLLSNVSEPEEEDIESLCKLMTTIGAKIDHDNSRVHMENYFARIAEVSKNKKLSSRIRFMLMDLIDLRKDGWKSRVEVAVPKTIAEIHKEAERKLAEENAEKLRLSRGGPRGGSNRSSVSNKSMQGRSQDVRSSIHREDQRRPSNLQPSSRNIKPVMKKNDRKEELEVKISRNSFAVFNEKEAVETPETPEAEEESPVIITKMTKEQSKNKIDAMIAEWWCNYDEKEIKLTLEELGGSEYFPNVIDSFLNAAMDRKLPDVEKTVSLFSVLFKQSIFSREQLISGCASQIEFAEDNLPDAPQLFKHLGKFLGRFILDGILSFSSLPDLFKPLISSKSRKPPAPKLLGELLVAIKEEGNDVLCDAFAADPIDLKCFWSPNDQIEQVFDDWIKLYDLSILEPSGNGEDLSLLEDQFSNFSGNSDELGAWVNEHPSICQSPKFGLQLSSVVLNHVASLTFYPPGSQKASKITTDTHIKMREIISSCKSLLLKYLTSPDLKLSLLEAIVNCWENVGQPDELLESLLRLVYELEIVEPETYYAYKATPKSSEASKRLVGWYKYLDRQ